MKILTLTSLWPNPAAPHFGLFVRNRVEAVSRMLPVRVVAPVPYGWQFLKKPYGWNPSVEMPDIEEGGSLQVDHPRYLSIPKLPASHGRCLAAGMRKRLQGIREEFAFDVLDAHWVYPDGYAAVRLGAQIGCPVVVTARGSDINLLPQYPRLRSQIEWTLSHADRLIAVSGALRDKMVALGADAAKVDVIGNGVRTDLFFPRPRALVRRNLGLPDGRWIGAVGNLVPEKGFELLVDAFAALRKREGFQNVGLVLVGEGPSRASLESRCAALGLRECVRLVGRKPYHEVPDWMSAMDILCLTSRREGWPNVVLEAVACGTPVVSTPVGGVPEILIQEGLGLMTSGWESHAFTDRLEEGLHRSWDAGEMTAYAAAHAWEAVAQRVIGSLQQAQSGWSSKTPSRT